jgi:hypothetical protein
LRYSGADTRGACELHTLNVWQSLADSDGDTNSYAYSDSNTNGYSHGDSHSDSNTYCDSNRYAYANSNTNCYSNSDRTPAGFTDAAASADTAAAPLSGSGKSIVHSAAGIDRSRLRVFDTSTLAITACGLARSRMRIPLVVADSLRDDPVPSGGRLPRRRLTNADSPGERFLCTRRNSDYRNCGFLQPIP